MEFHGSCRVPFFIDPTVQISIDPTVQPRYRSGPRRSMKINGIPWIPQSTQSAPTGALPITGIVGFRIPAFANSTEYPECSRQAQARCPLPEVSDSNRCRNCESTSYLNPLVDFGPVPAPATRSRKEREPEAGHSRAILKHPAGVDGAIPSMKPLVSEPGGF